jgi:hypothetical protein
MYQLKQSDLMAYLQLPKHFWAKVHGHYQPNGYRSYHPSIQLKQLATKYVEQVLLPNFDQPSVETRAVLETTRMKAQVDALITDGQGKKYLVGLKGATSPNRRLIQQLAFQAIVADDSSPVDRAFLVLLNPRYSRTDEINVEQLFQIQEITTELHKEKKILLDKIDSAFRVVNMGNPNDLHSCVRPESCPCPHLCHPNLPDYSIYDMTGLKTRDTIDLRNQGITRLVDIPMGYLRDDRQLSQRTLTKNKRESIDTQAIKNHLKSLEYPIHFLDYEAYGFPIPLYPGYWPQSSVVFQFSLHTLHESGELLHKEFLHLKTSDPSTAVIEALKESLPAQGSIVVWDKTLEASVHNHLAKLRSQHMLFLLDLNQRLFDLQSVFKSGAYADYRFKGSLSLKKILPVFAPEENHQGMNVANGLEAANRWYQLIHEPKEVEDQARLIQDLKAYCSQDTLGCVRILQKLQQVVGS